MALSVDLRPADDGDRDVTTIENGAGIDPEQVVVEHGDGGALLRGSPMKRGGPEHPKVIQLARRLGVSRSHAVGLLECLWHATATHAPEGDIGRWPNVRIAIALDWEGDADALVAGLIDAGFVEVHAQARLVVHDWHDHADQGVHRKLARAGRQIVMTSRELDMTSRQLDITRHDLQVGNIAIPESDIRITPPTNQNGRTPDHTKRGSERTPDAGPIERKSLDMTSHGASPAPASARVPAVARPGFAAFWAAYPRKVGKAKCAAWWKGARPDDALVTRMLGAIAEQRASTQWQRDGGQYIPHPATWLREGRWEDEPVVVAGPHLTDKERRSLAAGQAWLAKRKAEREARER